MADGSNNLTEFLFGAGASAAVLGSFVDVDSVAALANRTLPASAAMGLKEDPLARLWPIGVRLAAAFALLLFTACVLDSGGGAAATVGTSA